MNTELIDRLYQALQDCRDALQLYDGSTVDPSDPAGWQEREGHEAYLKADAAIAAYRTQREGQRYTLCETWPW